MVEQEGQKLDQVFYALSHATRRSILRRVGSEGLPVGELAKPFRMSLAAVSKHVQVLERAQLVERERRGQFQIVKLKAAGLRPAREWLAFYETFWSERLDALETFLETKPEEAAASPERGSGDGE